MTEQTRRRAPGMSPDARREMIVAHTLPLIAEHGAGVTTQLIAQAAGIGEATIFRVFEDKAELLRVCVKQAVRPEPLLDGLSAIPLAEPLPVRLLLAAELITTHARQVGSVLEALLVAGVRLHRDELSGADVRRAMHEGRARSMAVTADAIVRLLEADAPRFRVPLATAAMSFQYLVMSLMRRPFGRGEEGVGISSELLVEDVVDLFLHGAIAKN